MSLALRVDDLLRARGEAAAEPGSRSAPSLPQLLGMLVVFGLLYGSVMGSFPSAGQGIRPMQVVYSAIKVPLLLLATFFLALPSFFVLNSLLGLRADFSQAVRALVATQAGLTVILCSFAPLTALWYCSWGDYNSAILFNTVMFGCASLAAQFLLRRLYRPLIARSARHRRLLLAWLIIYAFVGVQLGWALRPFIGDPSGPTRFVRADAWSNAYMHLFEIVQRVTLRR